MIETPQPGKAQDCRELPEDNFSEPRCLQLVVFLKGTDTYFEYQYAYCTHCHRIWERSFFYQDWEPHWTILPWEKFMEMQERWRDGSGKDHRPHAEMGAGVVAFEGWALGLKAPISLVY